MTTIIDNFIDWFKKIRHNRKLQNEKYDYGGEVYRLLIVDKYENPRRHTCNLKKVEPETQKDISLVEFDYQIAYECEDDPNIEIAGFFHTHPYGANYQSSTDVDTMRGWCQCFGRPLICIIDSGNSIQGWWHYQEKNFSGKNEFHHSETLLMDDATRLPAQPSGKTSRIKVACPHGKIGK